MNETGYVLFMSSFRRQKYGIPHSIAVFKRVHAVEQLLMHFFVRHRFYSVLSP